jgi:hypothetical protein
MALTRHTRHNDCPVIAVKVTSDNCTHYAQLICKKHFKHIQWLSKADFNKIAKHTGTIIDTKFVAQVKRQSHLRG